MALLIKVLLRPGLSKNPLFFEEKPWPAKSPWCYLSCWQRSFLSFVKCSFKSFKMWSLKGYVYKEALLRRCFGRAGSASWLLAWLYASKGIGLEAWSSFCQRPWPITGLDTEQRGSVYYVHKRQFTLQGTGVILTISEMFNFYSASAHRAV